MKRIHLVTVAALLLSVACKKDVASGNETIVADVQSTLDLKVPNNFQFETEKTIDLNLTLGDAPLKGKYKVEVYDYQPYAGEGALNSFFLENTYQAKVQVASSIKQLFLVTHSPDGSSFMTVLPISGNALGHVFYKGKKSLKSSSTPVSPDCTSGCDQTITHNNSWWDADDEDDVYCVSGSYSGGGITVEEATLRLCSTGNIQNVTLEDEAELVIIDGANVTIRNLAMEEDSEIIVHANASLTVTNWFNVDGEIHNIGTLSIADMTMDKDGKLVNDGSFSATGNSWSTIEGEIENNSAMSFAGDVELAKNGKLENNCSFVVNGQFHVNDRIKNYSYIQVDDKTTVKSKGKFHLHDGAIAVLEDLWLDGGAKVQGKGTTSIVKVSGVSTSWSNGQVKGNLEYCDANGIESFSNNTIKSGAVEACNLYVATSACVLSGNGQPAITDSDNDGVADNLDAYPNDAQRAANSFYPSENQFGTLAFEDLWPARGDYDFNDLVIDYRYQKVLNASNNVVDLKAKFVTRAIGGSFENGFGFQLDANSSAVNSVTGTAYSQNIINTNANGTESGQSKATVIVFDNAYDKLPAQGGFSFVNTVPGNPAVQADTTDIVVNFGNALSEAALGTAPYNPFIFVDATRGREVHLVGGQPTDLVDANYFGTDADNTTPNTDNTYKTAANLPWALNITSGFDYPAEKNDIVQTYHLFDNWAQSGGLSNTDWFQDVSGYRNVQKLY